MARSFGVILCRVIGRAVASRKDAALEGAKLLVTVEATPDGRQLDDLHVVADTLGAGAGDLVLVAIGSAARLTTETRSQPLDALVVAIVETVEQDGAVVYGGAP
jgi:ethanolamine utilization protein EutN